MARNRAAFAVVMVITVAVVLGCKQLSELGNKNGNNPRVDEAPKVFTLEGKEWRTFELAHTDFKVDLPGLPTDKTPDESRWPAGSKAVFSAMRINSYDEKGFGSSFTQLEPTGKRSFEIKYLADTSMTAIRNQVPDLTYTLDIKSDTNAKYNGTFTRNGKSYDLRGCCVYKKSDPRRVWAVMTLAAKDNPAAQTASQRIIDSVVFKGSTEECK